MTSIQVAQQTWQWLKRTGRVSWEAEEAVSKIGEDNFLAQAASRWELAGSKNYMQGMKTIIMTIVY